MAISLDSYLSGGGAVSSFTPTGDYIHGVTGSGAVTIDITAPAGKKIVFTHFRAVGNSLGSFNVGTAGSSFYTVGSLTIDSIDVTGSISQIRDFFGGMNYGEGAQARTDSSYAHAFCGFKIATFALSITINSGYHIEYTYYIADE